MSEIVEDYRLLREYEKERRAENRTNVVPQILKLRDYGFEVVRVNEYQYRIDDAIDLYPTRGRYHILSSGQRGYFNDPVMFMHSLFRKAAGK